MMTTGFKGTHMLMLLLMQDVDFLFNTLGVLIVVSCWLLNLDLRRIRSTSLSHTPCSMSIVLQTFRWSTASCCRMTGICRSTPSFGSRCQNVNVHFRVQSPHFRLMHRPIWLEAGYFGLKIADPLLLLLILHLHMNGDIHWQPSEVWYGW